MKKRLFIFLLFILVLLGCNKETLKGEIWEEIERNYSGEVFAVEEGYSYLKYADGELSFIEKQSEHGNFKRSIIYFKKEGNIHYYSNRKLSNKEGNEEFLGYIIIEIEDDVLVLTCEENDYIKTFKKVTDQKIIDKFN